MSSSSILTKIESISHGSQSSIMKAYLRDFSPTELFEVILANELTPGCVQLLEGITQANKNEETKPSITFITPQDVFEFITYVNKKELDNVWHPPQFIVNLKELCAETTKLTERNCEIPIEKYAQIIKHQLINIMCAPHIQKAEMLKKIWNLDETLTKLRKTKEKIDNSSNPNKKKIKRKKAKKTVIEPEVNDSVLDTSPNILKGSDDLKDHICFYVLTRFKDPALLKILRKHQIPINCLLQISRKEYASKNELDDFWKGINEMCKSVEEYKITEDIIRMKYVYTSLIPKLDKDKFFRERLTELTDILMEIPQLKRKHIQYIKHLYPFEFKDQELMYGPFPFYEANMEEVAIEYVSIPYIVSSIVEEVEKSLCYYKEKCRNDTIEVCQIRCEKYQQEYEIADKDKKLSRQKCPLRLSDFRIPHARRAVLRRGFQRVTRKFHEGDNLNKVLTVNKTMAKMVLSDYAILSSQKLMDVRREYENSVLCGSEKNKSIFHDELIASVKKPILTKEQTDHFLNLLYLNNMKVDSGKCRFKQLHSKYLCTGEEVFEDLNFLPDSIFLFTNENLFERFDSMLYRWIEPLPTTALVQLIYTARQEFSSCNFQYCKETNTLLVYFHHNLSPAGTRSTIWRESLRTVTCLRDFCSFYIFEDAEWLSKHPPVKQVKYEHYKRNEETYFFQGLVESDNPYCEYNQYLIPYRYCGDVNCQGNLSCYDEECNKISPYSPLLVQMPNLREIMTEIKDYPPGNVLKKHCAKERQSDTILSFDRRPQRFGLTGSTHEFFSHDGIKISIDTSRFHFEDFRIRFSMEFDKNILFGHFEGNDVNIHVVSADGTIINFYTVKDDIHSTTNGYSDIAAFKNIASFLSVREPPNKVTNFNYLESISSVYYFEREKKTMESVYENESSEDVKSKSRRIFDDESTDVYTKILKYLKPPNETYKFVYHKTKYLSTKFKKQNIAYSSIIEQILRHTVQQEDVPVYRRRILLKDYSKTQKDVFHIKITLPNGLVVESLRSEINSDEVDIKQAHSERGRFKNIADEDYRLFFNNGLILIRCSNGNMKILDAQGTIIEIKQKTLRTNLDFERKKCLESIDMCRKMFYKLKKRASRKKKKVNLYKRSRRGHLKCSTNLYSTQSNVFRMLNECQLPFTKIDLFSIDGYLYKIRENIVKRNQFARNLDNYDFKTHETLRQRTDNMKLLNKMNGNQIAMFPDGTKISKTMVVDKELQFFRKRDKDGWVFITTNYLYEHPYYLPIEFKNNPKATLIHLKENTKLNLGVNECDIIFKDDITLNVNSEKIRFEKICPKCTSECTCDISIQPINSQKKTEDYEPFFVFKDSYNKQFTSDNQGRCKVNTDFIHGELNNMDCNHFLRNDYQKVFLLHGDLSGDLLWNDKMVQREIEKIEKEIVEGPLLATLEELTTKDKSMTSIKFIRNYYVGLSQKYLWPNSMFPATFSTWSDAVIEQVPIYQVSRSIFNMVHEKEINHLNNIFKMFSEN